MANHASAPQWLARFTEKLRADPEERQFTRQVRGSHYSLAQPAKVTRPTLLAHSKEVVNDLGFAEGEVHTEAFAQLVTGQSLGPGSVPYAMCYGGHQFGHWAGQLGDGRAINLGEIVDSKGATQTLQLKGAGPTPYSRSADGWAVLRSSVREFLCSEAMFHLGVPTTRALSLALTGDEVMRDMFYDGNARMEPGAIVCRVAPSFVRFGSFEILAARSEQQEMRELADFVIDQHFPELKTTGKENSPDTYTRWFHEICMRTATMITEWSRVGFVHGVMNTDNMSILGLTIDYGPYGWLEGYEPGWTPNTTDGEGKRYAFGNQSRIGLWNLLMLANAIHPLIGDEKPLQEALGAYTETYDRGWERMMAGKLGFSAWQEGTDETLTRELLAALELGETDWTIFFRGLAQVKANPTDDANPWPAALYSSETSNPEHEQRRSAWLASYRTRLQQDGRSDGERAQAMNAVNPKYVLRNYLAQLAIDDAEKGDTDRIHTLLDVLRRPYDEQPEHESLAVKRPEWARNRAGCSMLSCSS